MRGIHSRFGLDCWLRSSPTSPCTSRDKTLNIIYRINAFTKKMPLKEHFSFDDLNIPNLISCKKKVFQSEIEATILSLAGVGSVWQMIFGFSHLSDVSLAFYPNFPLRPICTHWSLNMLLTRRGRGREAILWTFSFLQAFDWSKITNVFNALSCSKTPCFCHYCEIPLFSFDRQWLCLYSCQSRRDSSPQLETITEIMSTSLPRCQTSSHLHINTIVFNVNICIDGGKHQFGETTKIPDFKSLSWFLTQWYRNADVLL